jgi:D-3-phosphoglycerate dehydrogenase
VRNCVFQPRATIDFEVREGQHVLSVIHSDKRGTKKAVDDAIYEAGANNVGSAHVDFPEYGIAYDVSVLNQPLTDEQLRGLVVRAGTLTGEAEAIRSVRSFPIS